MKMKHNFAKDGNAKVKSVGMRISIIISIHWAQRRRLMR